MFNKLNKIQRYLTLSDQNPKNTKLNGHKIKHFYSTYFGVNVHNSPLKPYLTLAINIKYGIVRTTTRFT